MCADVPLQGGAEAALPPDCRTELLGVAFFDLSRIPEWRSSEDDVCVAAFLQQFYGLATRRIHDAGGRVVKFMGDAGLAVFPTERAESVIFGLEALSRRTRRRATECGLDTYLNANVHVGPVLAGSFGPADARRYDVIGKTVNIAARLGRRGLTLSPQAFRCLSAEGRDRFDKIKPPITYRLRYDAEGS